MWRFFNVGWSHWQLKCIRNECGRLANFVKLLLNASLKVFLEPAAWHVMPGRHRPGMTCQAAGSRTTFNEAFKRSFSAHARLWTGPGFSPPE